MWWCRNSLTSRRRWDKDCLLPVDVYAAGEKLALLVREQNSKIAADKMLRSTKLCLQGSHSADYCVCCLLWKAMHKHVLASDEHSPNAFCQFSVFRQKRSDNALTFNRVFHCLKQFSNHSEHWHLSSVVHTECQTYIFRLWKLSLLHEILSVSMWKIFLWAFRTLIQVVLDRGKRSAGCCTTDWMILWRSRSETHRLWQDRDYAIVMKNYP